MKPLRGFGKHLTNNYYHNESSTTIEGNILQKSVGLSLL